MKKWTSPFLNFLPHEIMWRRKKGGYILGKKKLLMIVLLLLLIAVCIHLPSWITADSITVEITGDVVNVREKPGTSHSIVTQIKKGETYPVEKEQGDWYEIKLPSGKTGWIANWLAAKQVNTGMQSGMVNVDGLNVRADATASSDVVGTLNSGEKVKIIRENSGWYEISYESGTAWVSAQYVEKSPGKRDASVSEERNIAILHDGTNIRKKPELEAPILGTAHAGEVYEVMGEKNNWYKIKTDNGKTGFIASWVVSSTNRPVLHHQSGGGISGKTVVIDAGHGGYDQGAKGSLGTIEKDLTLKTARLLDKKLKKAGANVIMTRSRDEYVPLYNRTNTAIENRADAFISLHYDSIEDTVTNGHTTYYYYSYDKKLADTIHWHLGNEIKLKDRGTKFGNYYVLRENSQPSILLELGYLSNAAEEQAIDTKRYRDTVTTAIVKGLKDYFSN